MKVSQIFESMEGMGATTASSVAAFPSRLGFDQQNIDPNGYGFKKIKRPNRVKNTPVIRRSLGVTESALTKFDVSTAMLFTIDSPICEGEYTSVINDVNGKIDNARKQRDLSDQSSANNTSTFGLQDAQGNIVRVTVDRDEAPEFEASLNSILSDTENPKEIAEIIYILRTDYDIVNVEWAEPITEDDAMPYTAIKETPDEKEGKDGELDFGDLDVSDELDSKDDKKLDGGEEGKDDNLDLDLDVGDEEDNPNPAEEPGANGAPPIALQSQTVDLLQQVIELLKKETDARAAEAELQRTKTQTEMDKIAAEQQKREIDRQVELAQVEEFEEREKEQSKHERLIQRIARYRSKQ